jgi:hypothetical protein
MYFIHGRCRTSVFRPLKNSFFRKRTVPFSFFSLEAHSFEVKWRIMRVRLQDYVKNDLFNF